jgi:hypothetical protein
VHLEEKAGSRRECAVWGRPKFSGNYVFCTGVVFSRPLVFHEGRRSYLRQVLHKV